ncbi:hypothetical protein M3J09_001847 [Ascochyta lentis]
MLPRAQDTLSMRAVLPKLHRLEFHPGVTIAVSASVPHTFASVTSFTLQPWSRSRNLLFGSEYELGQQPRHTSFVPLNSRREAEYESTAWILSML